jgi:hypothetical protein
LSKTAVIPLRSPLFSSANLKISMLSISSSKNSDEIKEYLTHLDLKKLDEEDWTYFDNFLSTDECIKIVNSFEDNKSPGPPYFYTSYATFHGVS